MKLICCLYLFLLLTVVNTHAANCANISPNKNIGNTPVSIEAFGARANDVNFDNAPAIVKALNSANTIVIPAGKTYTVRSCIQVNNLSGKTIKASKAAIINRNYDARTFLFVNCNSIHIIGGLLTRDVLPTYQNGKEQSTLGFKDCHNISVTGVHIRYSPEMGIDNNVVIGGTYTDNLIEYCLRDGIYAHYSANLKYIHNRLNNIKDDALSMHDYGLDNQKALLHAAGLKQAGYSEISNNQISNCVQGVSSIACTSLRITNNTITNTVNAGISVFDSENYFPNSTARVNHVVISGNILKNTGFTGSINTLKIANKAKNSSGRAAIFVGCVRTDRDFTTSKMRLSEVTVTGNQVSNSAVNGATLYNVDGLVLKNNTFTNCHSDTNDLPQYTGNIIEIINCTKISVAGNSVVDSRPTPLHDRAYKIDNSTGSFADGGSKGFKMGKLLAPGSRLN